MRTALVPHFPGQNITKPGKKPIGFARMLLAQWKLHYPATEVRLETIFQKLSCTTLDSNIAPVDCNKMAIYVCPSRLKQNMRNILCKTKAIISLLEITYIHKVNFFPQETTKTISMKIGRYDRSPQLFTSKVGLPVSCCYQFLNIS